MKNSSANNQVPECLHCMQLYSTFRRICSHCTIFVHDAHSSTASGSEKENTVKKCKLNIFEWILKIPIIYILYCRIQRCQLKKYLTKVCAFLRIKLSVQKRITKGSVMSQSTQMGTSPDQRPVPAAISSTYISPNTILQELLYSVEKCVTKEER